MEADSRAEPSLADSQLGEPLLVGLALLGIVRVKFAFYIYINSYYVYNESLINKKLNIKDFVLKSFYVYVLELLVFKIVFKLI